MKLVYFFLLFFYCQISYGQLSHEVNKFKEIENSLRSSKNNRSELQKVLNHYSLKTEDSLKLQAAFYLIGNMSWHVTSIKEKLLGNKLSSLIEKADTLYYSLVKGKTSEELLSSEINAGVEQLRIQFQKMVKEINFYDDGVEIMARINDVENYNSDFLISQIENAFQLREKSGLVKKLNFDEFCGTILPYNFINGKYISRSGAFLNNFFSKYLGEIKDNRLKIIEAIKRYNITIANFRKILGHYPLSEKVGFEEALFESPLVNWDCFDMTNFGGLVLNACGIPVKVEFDVNCKLFASSHSTLSFPNYLGLSFFTPEIEIPVPVDKRVLSKGFMNFYQYCFEFQSNTPYFLKTPNEFIPPELSNPFIKDVSAFREDTTTLTLPFLLKTSNNLAYLATFNRISGIFCTSWGVINKKSKTVTFKNALPGSLYFPVYYKGDERIVFDDPFFLKIDTVKGKVVYSKSSFNLYKNKVLDSVFITRKWPEKTTLRTLATSLIGTVVLGANSADFKIADTLYVFDYSPAFKPQDVVLKTKRPYRYYRIVTPNASLGITLSEIEFLTDKKYGYKQTDFPMPLYKFNFKDIGMVQDSSLVKIVGNINPGLPQYDGSVETAPKNLSKFTQEFSNPMIVTRLRFIPLNANNGIVSGNQYILYSWENGDWKQIRELQTPTYQFLFYQKLQTNKLYWLKNVTTGKEEALFLLDAEGKQQFLYSDIFNKLRWDKI